MGGPAACCVTKKELLEIGGFDEIYLNGCEDVDLCLRMTSKIKTVILCMTVWFYMLRVQVRKKLFNDKNSQILKKDRAKNYILTICFGSYNHAWTYLCRGIMKPWSVNLRKWTEALLIFFRIKELGQMN